MSPVAHATRIAARVCILFLASVRFVVTPLLLTCQAPTEDVILLGVAQYTLKIYIYMYTYDPMEAT